MELRQRQVPSLRLPVLELPGRRCTRRGCERVSFFARRGSCTESILVHHYGHFLWGSKPRRVLIQNQFQQTRVLILYQVRSGRMIQNQFQQTRVLILYQGRLQFQQNQAAPARSPRATDKSNLEFARPRIEYFRRAGERIRLSLPLASSSKGHFYSCAATSPARPV